MGRSLTYGLIFLASVFTLQLHAQEEGEKVIENPPAVSDSLFYDPNQPNDSYSKHHFAEKTAAEPIEERKLDRQTVDKVRSDDAYWYANLEPEKKKETKESESFLDSDWFNSLFWILLVAAFVALLIWFLASSNIRLFRKRSTMITEKETETDVITEDIFALNFEREIEKAVAAKNYRLAVRLHYLQVLRKLTDRGLIDYTHEKTNSDYLFQLAGGSYYKDFFRLTRNFEYVWYGKFDLSPELYSMMQTDFSTFKKQIG